MLKTLFFLAIIGGTIWFFFIKKRPKKQIEETMVECQKCGTFISQTEAIYNSGRYFCSHSCLKKES